MSSLRERVQQILMENSTPTPGVYFGSGYCGGAKANPWIEAVKKYGSVKEAKKYYKKGAMSQEKAAPVQEKTPKGRSVPQEIKDKLRAIRLMREEMAREKSDEEMANKMLAQSKADYKMAKKMAPKRFTKAKAEALVKKIRSVADKYAFSDADSESFEMFMDFLKALPAHR